MFHSNLKITIGGRVPKIGVPQIIHFSRIFPKMLGSFGCTSFMETPNRVDPCRSTYFLQVADANLHTEVATAAASPAGAVAYHHVDCHREE